MAYEDNRPTIERLKRQLRVSAAEVPALGIDVDTLDQDLLEDYLVDSMFFIEGETRSRFNARKTTEVRDGNGTKGMELYRWPIGKIEQVKVELPVLALNRVYTDQEVKTYRWAGRFSIFTFKLAAEHASLHLDAQVYGNFLPQMPQCVEIIYTYGFPQYDPELNRTTFDGGATFEAGDTREPNHERHLRSMQQAAIADAAACYLGEAAGLAAGYVRSVSFDGFSQSTDGQGYAGQVQALIARRDQLLGRIKRRMHVATVGG